MKTLSVVIPVYFNEGSLPPLFEKLREVEARLAGDGLALELIFVDDGSGDRSLAELLAIKAARPETRVIKLSRNFGAMHAAKCGLQFVRGDCFILLAADLQDPPELIPEMAGHWRQGAKFTIAVRISREDPPLTRLFAALYYWLLHRPVVSDYPEGGYDMALMDRSLLPHLQNSSKNLHTQLLVYSLGFRPALVRYHRPKRRHGRSRWTFAKKFKSFLDVMLGFSVTPIRLISGVGAVVSLLSFGYGVLVTINAALGHMPVAGYASLAALITFLLGLIIVMLGVIGEYLWRIFDEVNKRPEVVIDEIY
jgi:polyisoprenyl-phosphate glycosyltransferase